jgi:hypothetical protein
MVGAEALGLEIEEQTLGEVFFVFDDGDEGGWMRVCHGHRSIGTRRKSRDEEAVPVSRPNVTFMESS